jgi:hypothetical protein
MLKWAIFQAWVAPTLTSFLGNRTHSIPLHSLCDNKIKTIYFMQLPLLPRIVTSLNVWVFEEKAIRFCSFQNEQLPMRRGVTSSLSGR